MIRFLEDKETHDLRSDRVEMLYYKTTDAISVSNESAVDRYRRTTVYDHYENEVYMTEIQLKNIVERLQGEEKDTKTDGDESMVKDGTTISKFSFEALSLGPDVQEAIKSKIRARFKQSTGDDSVFPTKNGSPKILTKFIEHPYSYDLLPEYEKGEKKLPCVKAMNWEDKTYTAHVIRGFIKGTPVVETCSNPRCISRSVIVPKLAPGQAKDDPNHGFRVCVWKKRSNYKLIIE